MMLTAGSTDPSLKSTGPGERASATREQRNQAPVTGGNWEARKYLVMGEWVGWDSHISEQARNHSGQGHGAPSSPLAAEG